MAIHQSNPYVHVIDANFRTLYQGNADFTLVWLEKDSYKELATQVGIGKDFQMLSISEFKSLYG